MMRSMFSGVSGLRNHQTRMDVIGNNIANVNTIGFKGSRVNFQDILSQTIQGAAMPQGNRGGTNPMQVGLGMGIASIDTIFTDGSTQTTGKQSDLALQGQGFFIINDGAKSYYTRAGNFDFDTNGNYIVPGTGLKVQGWMANNGVITADPTTIGDIIIPVGTSIAASPTTEIVFAKNLNAEDTVPRQTATTVYDSLGFAHIINLRFYKPTTEVEVSGAVFDDTANPNTHIQTLNVVDNNGDTQTVTVTAVYNGADWDLNISDGTTTINLANQDLTDLQTGFNVDMGTYNFDLSYPGATAGAYNAGNISYLTAANSWQWNASENDVAITSLGGNTGTITFTSNGAYSTSTGGPLTLTFNNGATPLSVNVDMTALTQYASEFTAVGKGNGYTSGSLETVTLDTSGVITGTYSNGINQVLAQVALAIFNNPAGLLKASENKYEASNNSGIPDIGTANSGGRGRIAPGTLEMSNVDLSQQFTDMIVTQRGFQANSKIITTSDEMLQELVNLKR